MKTVYVETSILSYLTARPSRDLVAAGRQQMTHEWWATRRARFDVYISPLVEQEAHRDDPDAARRRVEVLGGLPVLEIVDEAYELAAALIMEGALPPTAEDDAMHIALAVVHGMDYLLTWNCRHIDNAETKRVTPTKWGVRTRPILRVRAVRQEMMDGNSSECYSGRR